VNGEDRQECSKAIQYLQCIGLLNLNLNLSLNLFLALNTMTSETGHRQYIISHYKKIAKVYGIADLFLTAVKREVVRLIGKKNGKILDVACGTGPQAAALARTGHNVIGLDISDAMLRKAKRKNQSLTNVTLIQADSAQMPFRDSVFDVATISFALHEMPEAIAIVTLEEMKRVTKKDGQIIIVDLNLSGRRFIQYVVGQILLIVEPKYYREYLKKGLEEYTAKAKLTKLSHTTLYFGLASIIVCRPVSA